MATNIPIPLVTRETDPPDGSAKGAPLTSTEVDANFINIKKAVEEMDAAAGLLFDTATGGLKSETVEGSAIKNQEITYAKIADIHYADDDSVSQNTIRVRLPSKNQVNANELFFVKVASDNSGPVSVQVEKSPKITSITSLSYLASSRTVTVVTTADHGILSGDIINLSGATEGNYDQAGATATRISDTSFSYVIPGGDPEPHSGVDGSETPTSATVESQLKVLVGATQLYRDADLSIAGGTIKAGSLVSFIYTGTSFRLINSFSRNVTVETKVNNISEYVSSGTAFPGNGLSADFIHGFTIAPASVSVSLVCTSATDGYAEGDEVDARDAFSADAGDATNAYNQAAFSVHTNDQRIQVTQNTATLLIQSKAGGVVGDSVAADTANWELKVRALFYQDVTNDSVSYVQPPLTIWWHNPLNFIAWGGKGFVIHQVHDGTQTGATRSTVFDMKTSESGLCQEIITGNSSTDNAMNAGNALYWIESTIANSHFRLVTHGNGTQIRGLLLGTDNTNPVGTAVNIATSGVRDGGSGRRFVPLFAKPPTIPAGANPAWDPTEAGITPRHAPAASTDRIFGLYRFAYANASSKALITSLTGTYVDVLSAAATYGADVAFDFLNSNIGNITALTGTGMPESFATKSYISGISYNPVKRRIYLLSHNNGLVYVFKFRGKLGDNKAESGSVTKVQDPDNAAAFVTVDASDPSTWLGAGSSGSDVTADTLEWFAMLANGEISNDIDSWWYGQCDTNANTTSPIGGATPDPNYIMFEKALVIPGLGQTDQQGGQNYGSELSVEFDELTGEEKSICTTNRMFQRGNHGFVARLPWREALTV